MDNFLLDTNIIIDASSAKIIDCLNYNSFYVSQVVFKEEVIKQISGLKESEFNKINETIKELLMAKEYHNSNKKISFYDAINLAIAKERQMILVTGDQQLIKCAEQINVNCIGVLRLIEVLIDNGLLDIKNSIIALQNLKQDFKRRVPHSLIDLLIEKLKKQEVLL